MKVELGCTYVTKEGSWVKIISRSCMTADSDRPFTADTGITYSEARVSPAP